MAQRKTDFLTPITTDHLKMPMDAESAAKVARRLNSHKVVQATAADATFDTMFEGPGRIVSVRALHGGAAAAAGESMVVDVLKNGATVLTAPLTFDDAPDLRDRWQQATLDASKAGGTTGDLVRISLDYTAGGAATPMTNLMVIVEFQYD